MDKQTQQWLIDEREHLDELADIVRIKERFVSLCNELSALGNRTKVAGVPSCKRYEEIVTAVRSMTERMKDETYARIANDSYANAAGAFGDAEAFVAASRIAEDVQHAIVLGLERALARGASMSALKAFLKAYL